MTIAVVIAILILLVIVFSIFKAFPYLLLLAVIIPAISGCLVSKKEDEKKLIGEQAERPASTLHSENKNGLTGCIVSMVVLSCIAWILLALMIYALFTAQLRSSQLLAYMIFGGGASGIFKHIETEYPKNSFTSSDKALYFLLITFFPVGIFEFCRDSRRTLKQKIIVSAGLTLILGLGLGITQIADTKRESKKIENQEVSETTATTVKATTVTTTTARTTAKPRTTTKAKTTTAKITTTVTVTETVAVTLPPTQPVTQPPAPVQITHEFWINTDSSKFHYPDCRTIKDRSEPHWAVVNADRSELIAQGYSPCGVCDP